jgi:hypothetical protein
MEEAGPDAVCPYIPVDFVCYGRAICEVQTDGECGWTQPNILTACIADVLVAERMTAGGTTESGRAQP